MADQAKILSREPVRLKDHHPRLQHLLRSLAQRRFVDFTARHECLLDDLPEIDDFIYGAHVSLIQIAARDLRLTFKAHFNMLEVAALTARKNGLTRTPEQVQRSTYDLFREYTNLVAGAMAKQFQSCGVLAGISLPLATSGFNEVISSDELQDQRMVDFWVMRSSDFRFICSVHLDILRPEVLSLLSVDDIGAEGEGEIELL